MIVEMGKKYRLASGALYRLFCVDGGGNYPVLGAYLDPRDNLWTHIAHKSNGSSNMSQDTYDLVEVKPRIKGEFWVVHRANGHKNWCMDYDHAERLIGIWEDNVIAITHHTYDCEEGVGLK